MNGREIAEAIAKNYGIEPKVLKVEMIGTKDIKKLFKLLEDTKKNNHKNPIIIK